MLPNLAGEAVTYEATTEALDLGSSQYNSGLSRRSVLYHSVLFENLEPDTLYAYRVGSGSLFSEWQSSKDRQSGQPAKSRSALSTLETCKTASCHMARGRYVRRTKPLPMWRFSFTQGI